MEHNGTYKIIRTGNIDTNLKKKNSKISPVWTLHVIRFSAKVNVCIALVLHVQLQKPAGML